MKELSIEQKARAYDKAIEKLREFYRDYDTVSCLIDVKEELANLFPELAESEDERIRGAIIDHLKDNNLTEWAAWLEKQGGPFDDNIITRDDEILQAISIGLTDAEKDLGWSDFGGLPIEEIQNWLEKQGEQEADDWKEGNIIRHGGILALVIKGRRAMKSNGEIFTVQYPDEWVKAAPNEIEHFFNEFEKQGEQKPAWSEKDENFFANICSIIDSDRNFTESAKGRCKEWLKSIKQRMEEQ